MNIKHLINLVKQFTKFLKNIAIIILCLLFGSLFLGGMTLMVVPGAMVTLGEPMPDFSFWQIMGIGFGILIGIIVLFLIIGYTVLGNGGKKGK